MNFLDVPRLTQPQLDRLVMQMLGALVVSEDGAMVRQAVVVTLARWPELVGALQSSDGSQRSTLQLRCRLCSMKYEHGEGTTCFANQTAPYEHDWVTWR